MPENLLVAVMGHRDSGKSSTWYDLFGRYVKTGKKVRWLQLNDTEWVEVFVVSGSPQERDEYVQDLLHDQLPRIVLCSLQYIEGVWQSYEHFFANDYHAFVQWLNPGHDDPARYEDHLGLVPQLLAQPSVISMRDGKIARDSRVREIREYIAGWARPRGLIHEYAPAVAVEEASPAESISA